MRPSRVSARPWLLAAFITLVVSALGAQGPDPAVKSRLDAFVAALGSGDADRYEAMAKEAFAPEFLAKRTAADRRQFVQRVHGDFGALTVQRVLRNPEGMLTLHVRGATGLEGRIEMRIEDAPPHRITSLGIEVGDRDEPSDGPLPPAIRGSMPTDELTRVLDEYVGRLAAADSFAGVVLVAKDGTPVFEKAYGLADRDRQTPNTTTTRFNLGSINKSFTKAAIARLMSEGALTLDDTIGKLLPDYPNADARSATVAQLLEHRAGIVDFFGPAFNEAPKSRFRSNADYYAFVAPQPLLFAPGSRRQYCNGCYIVLGAIIERLSGMKYEDYVGKYVFAPAGMTGAGYFQSDRLPPDTAHGYTRRGGAADTSLRDNASMHGMAGSGAGGGYASARDLLAFDNALRGQRLLDAAKTAWMLGVAAATPGRSDGGLGVAGGAPGVNAILESGRTWTVVVVGNLDPPTAERLGLAINRQLTR
jgi:CubicO group peptidase (beta-lactamase class C family)